MRPCRLLIRWEAMNKARFFGSMPFDQKTLEPWQPPIQAEAFEKKLYLGFFTLSSMATNSFYRPFFALFLFAVASANVLSAQITERFVKPIDTDSRYQAVQDSHLVITDAMNVAPHTLLLFLPGTGADAKSYRIFPRSAAALGYASIVLAYPNDLSAGGGCGASLQDTCYEDFRREVCYGTNLHPAIEVDTLNSITERLKYLLRFLHLQNSNQGWDQFLNGDQINWSKIATAGHSQGSGHALLLAKDQPLKGCFMFAGPQDYHFNPERPSLWLSSSSATPIDRLFQFSHLDDEVTAYNRLYRSAVAIGLTATRDTADVDLNSPPYGQAHCLYTRVTPRNEAFGNSRHNSPVVDFYSPKLGNAWVYQDVWDYMLGAVLTSIGEVSKPDQLAIFPNPCRDQLRIKGLKTIHAPQLFTMYGQSVEAPWRKTGEDEIEIHMQQLPSGWYVLRSGNQTAKIAHLNNE